MDAHTATHSTQWTCRHAKVAVGRLCDKAHQLTWWLPHCPACPVSPACGVVWRGWDSLLVELALRTTLTASLREGDAAAVGGHHAEVGHSQPVTMQRGQSEMAELGGEGRGERGGCYGCNGEVCMAESGTKTQAHGPNTPNHPNTLWWTPLE